VCIGLRKTFLPENIGHMSHTYEKLANAKCPNFTCYLPEKYFSRIAALLPRSASPVSYTMEDWKSMTKEHMKCGQHE